MDATWAVANIRHLMSLNVTPLFRGSENQVRGTGFLYADNAQVFLVTAYHVLQSEEQSEWSFQMHLWATENVVSQLVKRISFRVPQQVFFCPTADLAAVRLDLSSLPKDVAYKTVSVDNLALPGQPFWAQIMAVATAVEIPGYPGGVIDQHNNVPLYRFGQLAYDPLLDWSGDKLGVANIAVYPADSGAPVFWTGQAHKIDIDPLGKRNPRLVISADVKLVGVHVGGYDFQEKSGAKNPIALGIFVKASVLADNPISSWKPMLELANVKHQHPHVSRSGHSLHKSGAGFLGSDIPVDVRVDDCINVVQEPSDLEKAIFPLACGMILVEKFCGKFWEFSFSESGAVTCLRTGKDEFRRKSCWIGDDEERKLPFFTKENEDGSFDCIFISHKYDPRIRPDKVVASGFQCFDVRPGDKVPDAPHAIAWKIKD